MTLDYPTTDDIHAIHDQIVANSDATEPGIRTPEPVESAIAYISEGYFGEAPDTIHEKSAHLLRLIVADHPYVDGNKRTAMAAAVALYELNDYAFDPDDQIRAILRAFATDADSVDMIDVVSYLEVIRPNAHDYVGPILRTNNVRIHDHRRRSSTGTYPPGCR